ncbi:hypothetical protein MMC12_002382 [Toensbergia leucococca]|nr:hypothetical protein [Toensbergia leucococca]
MTELTPVLSRLGLEQYLERFISEGFETWETVLDITESDLDSLGVKLGHRRVCPQRPQNSQWSIHLKANIRLQREIANTRRHNSDQLLTSPSRSNTVEDHRYGEADDKPHLIKSEDTTQSSGKRKYRRHPKIDENAPDRPPSAYVIFSNKIREDLKPQSLSFTEIAKRVGESWQLLSPDDREPYELQASSDKERYHSALTKYKKTENYRDYAQYLNDFKAKNATSHQDGKRQRLETERSPASSVSAGSQNEATESSVGSITTGRGRMDSANSGRSHPGIGRHVSPGSTISAMSPNPLFGCPTPLPGRPSPSPVSPTLPLNTLGSPPNMYLQNTPHIQASFGNHDRHAEFMRGQQLPRILPYEHRKSRSIQSTPTSGLIDSAVDGRISPISNTRRSNHVAATFNRSDNSTSSTTSSRSTNLSNGSTAASSIYPPLTQSDSRSERSLPPLSTVGFKPMPGPTFLEQGAQPGFASNTGQSMPSFTSIPPLRPHFGSTSSGTTPKFLVVLPFMNYSKLEHAFLMD